MERNVKMELFEEDSVLMGVGGVAHLVEWAIGGGLMTPIPNYGGRGFLIPKKFI